jgi:hypothetical protein
VRKVYGQDKAEAIRKEAMVESHLFHMRVKKEIMTIPRGESYLYVIILGVEEKRILMLESVMQYMNNHNLPGSIMGINIRWSDENSIIKVEKVA